MNNATTSTPCPLCGHMTTTAVLSKYGFDLHRCAQCSHVYVNPMPADAQLREHYQNPAYFEGEQDQGYKSYDAMHRALMPHFDRRLNEIGALQTPPGKLLDVGCADGFFLQRAKLRGWEIHGVELSADMAAKASATLGIKVLGSVDALETGNFDAVTLWEVIEHLPRPIEFLSSLREHIRPGGVLMFSTPNTGHWQAVRRHDAWVSYRPPSHIQYFDAASAIDAAKRAGFDKVMVRKTMPLPAMPDWLDRWTKPLHTSLGSGDTSGNWVLKLWLWRAIRMAVIAFKPIAYPKDDMFATLEIMATRS
jgi:SAM-dependent methyltransferase